MKMKIAALALLLLFFMPLALAEDNVEGADETPTVDPVLVDEPVVDTETTEDPLTEDLETTPEENETTEEAVVGEELVEGDGGTGPDSPFYGFDVLFDDLSLMFTADPEARAELALKIAEERMLEAKTAAMNGKVEHYRFALREHKKQLGNAEEAVEGVEIDGTTERARNALRIAIKVKNAVEDQEMKTEVIKAKIKARLDGLTEEEKQAVLDEMDALREEIGDLRVKIKDKGENAKTNLRARTGQTEEEVDAEEDTLEEETGLRDGRKLRLEVKIRTAKKALEEAWVEAEASGEETGNLENEITEVAQVMNDLETEDGDEEYEALVETLEEYKNFGARIRALAHGLRTGDSTVEELREAARSIHVEVMEQVKERVNENARERIEANIETAKEKIEQRREQARTRTPDETDGEDEGTETDDEPEDDDVEDLEEDSDDSGNGNGKNN
jgi:hypothetical protein